MYLSDSLWQEQYFAHIFLGTIPVKHVKRTEPSPIHTGAQSQIRTRPSDKNNVIHCPDVINKQHQSSCFAEAQEAFRLYIR